jgi:Ca2+-binding RTX toxin-like protein
LTSIEHAWGSNGADTLRGDALYNILHGEGGADRIDGRAGGDKIAGFSGKDVLTGGTGRDQFVFSHWGSANVDRITDFKPVDDTIVLGKGAFTNLAVGNLASAAFKVLGTGAIDSSDRIIYDRAGGNIYYDRDGSGSAARQLVATVTDGTVLTAADFKVLSEANTLFWI